MSYQDNQLVLAAQHVAAGRLIVARQRALIAKMRAAGHRTLEHERTLTIFISTLTIFEDHEHALRSPRPRTIWNRMPSGAPGRDERRDHH